MNSSDRLRQCFKRFLYLREAAFYGFSGIPPKKFPRKTAWWSLGLLMLQRNVLITQSNNTMEHFCVNSERVKAVNYFGKKSPSQIFDWALYTTLLQVPALTRTFFREFVWIFRTSYQQGNCEWLSLSPWTTSSKLFGIFSWNFLFLVWSHFTCLLPKSYISKHVFKK